METIIDRCRGSRFFTILNIFSISVLLSALILLIDCETASGFNLKATPVYPTTIKLSWQGTCWSQWLGGTVCANSHSIYRNGEHVVEVSGKSFTDKNLDPDTEYCYQVRSFYCPPFSECYSAASNMVCVTISDPPKGTLLWGYYEDREGFFSDVANAIVVQGNRVFVAGSTGTSAGGDAFTVRTYSVK
jgi:hypothetical protein